MNQPINSKGKSISQLYHRRLVAVLGDIEALKPRLWQVIAQLAYAIEFRQFPVSVVKTLTNVHDYLERHRNHINYKRFKDLGLPLGSGIVESACKWLIQQRFKGVGMRWSEDGFNHLLHLRLAWVNQRFDHLFPELPSPNR